MINRQNYLDVLGFVKFHRKILQNTKYSAEQKRTRLQNALIWCGEVPFSQCWKVKKTYPEYLLEQVKQEKITNDYASRLCADFRDFLYWATTENRGRYNGIKRTFIESIRIKTYQDNAKTAKYYTLEEMRKIAEYSPENIRMERIKSGSCFMFLSGMRLGAFLSMPIACVNLDEMKVLQFPELGVYTKRKKRAVTALLNIPDLLDVVKEWDRYVRANSPSGATWYARFSAKDNTIDPKEPERIDRDKAYQDIQNSRATFYRDLKKLCLLVDIDYKNPHAFRHGHVHFGIKNAKTAEQVKAISQNVMHETTAITDKVYSRMEGDNVNSIITNLGVQTPSEPRDELRKNSETNVPEGITVKDLLSSMTTEEKEKILKEIIGL